MRIEPEKAAALRVASQAGLGANRDGVVAPQDHGCDVVLDGLVNAVRQVLASRENLVDVLQFRVLRLALLRLRREDVAPVLHLVAEVSDALVEIRGADGGRAHVDAAAT